MAIALQPLTRATTSQVTYPYGAAATEQRSPRARWSKTSALLWTAQALLAALFLFAGGTKLIAPAEVLAGFGPLPVPFLRFIGVCETLGALGLILPGLTRIAPVLTPLAAAGLVIIMIGATTVTLLLGGGASALVPLVVGIVAASIANGRRPSRQA